MNRGYIAMSIIGINDLSRIWNHWNDLLKCLAEDNNIILLGTKQESEYYLNNKYYIHKNIVNLMGKTNIKRAFEIIENSDIFISGETGLMHYANFIKKKSVIIFAKQRDFFRASHLNSPNFKVLFNPGVKEVLNIL